MSQDNRNQYTKNSGRQQRASGNERGDSGASGRGGGNANPGEQDQQTDTSPVPRLGSPFVYRPARPGERLFNLPAWNSRPQPAGYHRRIPMDNIIDVQGLIRERQQQQQQARASSASNVNDNNSAPTSAPTPVVATPVIPDLDASVIEFNSATGHAPPYREIPSVLISTLLRPNVKAAAAEPNWAMILSYFQSGTPRDGFGNLQDLLLLIIRVVLPNQIMTNRMLLKDLYTRLPEVPAANRLRYDAFDTGQHGMQYVDAIPLHAPSQSGSCAPLPLYSTNNVPPRQILASQPTPDGNVFLTWLSSVFATDGLHQMAHRRTDLDTYLTVTEAQVRALTLEQLLRRTIRALQMFWWLQNNNVQLILYQSRQWIGVENHSY